MDGTPAGEDNVGLPRDVDEGDGDTELVGEKTDGGEQVGEGHSLGAHLEGEDLDGVKSLHRGPAGGVADLEDVDPGEDSLGDGTRHIREVLIGTILLDIGDGGGDSNTDPAQATGDIDEDEHRATTETVDLRGTKGGEDDLDSVHAELDVDLGRSTADTSGFEELAEVVRDDTVSGPLAEEGDDAVHQETVTGSAVAEERAVIPPYAVGTVDLEMRLVLHHLQLDPLGVGVALAVVLGEDGLCLDNAAADVQPAGGLREEPGEKHDEAGKHHLQPHWDEPLGVAGVRKASASGAGGDERADGPEDVVETGGDTTMSGVRHLDDVGWAGGTNDADAESEEEAAAHELADAVGCDCGSLDDDADDDDGAGDEHAAAATPGVNSGTDEGDSDDAADLVHRGDDACGLLG